MASGSGIDYELTEDDVGKALTGTLLDAVGDAVDLTNVTHVKFVMGDGCGGTPVVNLEAAVPAANQTTHKGQVTYTFSAAGCGTPGDFKAQFVATFAGPTVYHFPTVPLNVRVNRKVG